MEDFRVPSHEPDLQALFSERKVLSAKNLTAGPQLCAKGPESAALSFCQSHVQLCHLLPATSHPAHPASDVTLLTHRTHQNYITIQHQRPLLSTLVPAPLDLSLMPTSPSCPEHPSHPPGLGWLWLRMTEPYQDSPRFPLSHELLTSHQRMLPTHQDIPLPAALPT